MSIRTLYKITFHFLCLRFTHCLSHIALRHNHPLPHSSLRHSTLHFCFTTPLSQKHTRTTRCYSLFHCLPSYLGPAILFSFPSMSHYVTVSLQSSPILLVKAWGGDESGSGSGGCPVASSRPVEGGPRYPRLGTDYLGDGLPVN